MRITITVFFFIAFLSLSAQKQKTKLLKVRALNNISYLGIKGVSVSTKYKTYSIITSNTGSRMMKIPRDTDSLFFYHDDYKPGTISILRRDRSACMKMDRLKPDSSDLPKLKNTFTFYPLKLISGGYEFRYERFIKTNYSFGLFYIRYFRGRQAFGEEEYTGYKISPCFRYYITRNRSFMVYFQAQLIVAYFNFSKLNYVYGRNYTESVEEEFWTGGIGGTFGYSDILGKSKHLIVDLGIGFQILPALYPTEIKPSNPGYTYTHNNLWWYAGGPGSFIELKLAIGGIF